MFIGLTGLIGAGKSTAARILESFGAAVIDADMIGRRVVDQSEPLRRSLARAFGADVIFPNGCLDRSKVAARAFVDDSSRQTLNSLVHPLLLREISREMKRLNRKLPVVVIDAALLLDWNLDKQLDMTIVIDAPEDLRFARLATRGLSKNDVLARQHMQLPHSEFLSRATLLITNDGSEEDLRFKLSRVWAEVTKNPGANHEQQ